MAHDLVERSGRSYCSVCNGVDGSSLATDCPGRPLTKAQVDGLYRGSLDYRDGEWVNPNAPPVEDPEPPQPELHSGRLPARACGATAENRISAASVRGSVAAAKLDSGR